MPRSGQLRRAGRPCTARATGWQAPVGSVGGGRRGRARWGQQRVVDGRRRHGAPPPAPSTWPSRPTGPRCRSASPARPCGVMRAANPGPARTPRSPSRPTGRRRPVLRSRAGRRSAGERRWAATSAARRVRRPIRPTAAQPARCRARPRTRRRRPQWHMSNPPATSATRRDGRRRRCGSRSSSTRPVTKPNAPPATGTSRRERLRRPPGCVPATTPSGAPRDHAGQRGVSACVRGPRRPRRVRLRAAVPARPSRSDSRGATANRPSAPVDEHGADGRQSAAR